MAGMPKTVVRRANEILQQLERNSQASQKPEDATANSSASQSPNRPTVNPASVPDANSREGVQLSFFQLDDPVLSQVRDEIINLNIDNLTPIEALNKLNEIKRIVKG